MPTVSDSIDQAIKEVFDDINRTFSEMDFTPVLKEQIHDFLLVLHAGYFDEESGPDGEKWEQLAPFTVARKGHDTRLFETGSLRDSLTKAEHESHIGEFSPTELLFGTRHRHSHKHQRGRRRLPKREHVGLSEENVDPITELIADFAVDELIET